MKSSQIPSKPAAAAKPAPYCAFPNCKVPPTKTYSRCMETQYCSKDHQTEHWRFHKKIGVAPQKKMSAPVLARLRVSVQARGHEERGVALVLRGAGEEEGVNHDVESVNERETR